MSHLEVSINDSIATLTMNRPEARNALSMEMRSELCDGQWTVVVKKTYLNMLQILAITYLMQMSHFTPHLITMDNIQIKKEFMHFGRVEYPKIIQKPMTILLAKHNT